MQAGHLPLALAIATYDWNPRMAAFCLSESVFVAMM